MNSLSVAFKYVEDVVSGRKITGEHIKRLVDRFIYLYDNGKEHGIYFNERMAEYNLAFFDQIRHHKGSYALKKDNYIQLSDWQSFAQAYTFGFYQDRRGINSGRPLRLVRESYIEVAKKNGKTTLAAGNAAFMALADHEPGAEVYIAAPSFDQANIAFKDCKEFIGNSSFATKCRILAKSITYKNSFIRPVSSDPKYLDGKFCHFGLLDEVHEHKNDGIYENLKSGAIVRDNPLLYLITTAGFNLDSFCYTKRKSILNNLYTPHQEADLSVFGAIYTLDEGDNYENPEVWGKSNPQIGLSIDPYNIQAEINSIRINPERYEPVLTKNLNIWVDSPKSFIKLTTWDACSLEFDITELYGCKCYGGIDLSLTDDLTAYVLVIEKDQRLYLYPRFYLPKQKGKELSEQKVFNFLAFARQGNISLQDSAMIDHNQLLNDIKQDIQNFDYQFIGIDPWRVSHIAIPLAEMIGQYYNPTTKQYISRLLLINQNAANHSPSMQELYRIAHTQQLLQNNNPIMRWCIQNTRIHKDLNDNWRPMRESHDDKIDGTLGAMMALRVRLLAIQGGMEIKESVYSSRSIYAI